MKTIERQVIACWYTPEEKLPPEGDIVLVTISGKRKVITYDHAFALASWFDDGDGWMLEDYDDLDYFTIHAWCDIEPYKG